MIGDFLRYWWDSLYWNLRKSRYAVSGRRGPAPCQHPSDSGRAGRTACVACQSWRRAARFRRVCPLLEHRDGEWRCSVDAGEVRPFWGRALGTWFGTALVLWILLTGVAFGVFRGVGFEELRYADFWSPQFLGRFHAAQGAYYSAAARRSFEAGDFPRGVLSLSIAYARAPRRWEDGLLLGQLLARTRQYHAADQTFQSLIDGFPERAEEFATIWCDSLLLRADPEKLTELALARLAAGSGASSTWWRIVVHVVRREPEPSRASRLLKQITAASLPRGRKIAAIETALRANDWRAAEAVLALGAPTRDAGEAQYRCDVLMAFGRFEDAALQRSIHASLLGEFHAGLLGVNLALQRRQESLADLAFGNLLVRDLHPAKLDLLLAELLRNPSRQRAEDLLESWPETERRADLLTARRLVAMACAVGGGEGELRPKAGDRADEILCELAASFRPAGKPLPIRTRQALLGALALPREVTLVLLR